LEQLDETIAPEIVVRPTGIEKSYFHDKLELSIKQSTGGLWTIMAVSMVFFCRAIILVRIPSQGGRKEYSLCYTNDEQRR
jgi:hypothetical protein